MKYTKAPISIPDQIAKLKGRGLKFKDEGKAQHYLSNISFYRLRAYTYPFQDNTGSDHPFTTEMYFEDIIQLYVFDRQLRILIFNAIEKIEIAFRAQLINTFGLAFGSHWYADSSLYSDSVRFAENIAVLQGEINRSRETFITHYKNKYTDPAVPPCWMSLEVSSLGLLSKIYSNLKNDSTKNEIALSFGLKSVMILENWMYCLSILRNITAHHGRVWNRRLAKITIPRKPINLFIEGTGIHPNKVYPAICAIQYILNIISPNNGVFKESLIFLMKQCPHLQEKEMGFPENWKDDPFWKE